VTRFRNLVCTLLLFGQLVHASPAESKCRTHRCWARVSEKRHAHYWVKRFHRFPVFWQRWAHGTSWCEARHNPYTNTGNGFYGGFQYTLQTAHVAGFRRRPDLTTWYEQGVRSIRYAMAHGTGAWPRCG
jgi:hypothetical protein